MNNREILKLVRSNNYNGYRAVLDRSMVDDIKYYSWWGESRFLYDLHNVLKGSRKLNLLRPKDMKEGWYDRYIKLDLFSQDGTKILNKEVKEVSYRSI